MAEPTPLQILYRADLILKERGWDMRWSRGDIEPLNIRCAVAKACTAIVGSDAKAWYRLYTDSCGVLTKYLKGGITEWEFKVKHPAEVEAMFKEVLKRMERNEIRPDYGVSRRRTSDSRPSAS